MKEGKTYNSNVFLESSECILGFLDVTVFSI